MGCWNGTCAISTLPILYDDPCRIVFLRQRRHAQEESGAGFCYSTGIWDPITMAIPAKYDDYGAVEGEDQDDWRVVKFLKWLREVIKPMGQGPNSVHDTPIVPEEIKTLHDICEHIHSQGDRVFIDDMIGKSLWASMKAYAEDAGETYPEYVPDHLGYCLIREDIYQGLIASPFHDWRGNLVKVADHYTEMREWFDGVLEDFKKAPEDSYERLLVIGLVSGGERIWGGGEAGINFREIKSSVLTDVALAVKKGKDVDTLEEVLWPRLRAVVDLRWVNWHMDNARLHWSPQQGAGSQGYGYHTHQALIDLKQKVLTTERERRDREAAEMEAKD